MPLRKRVLVTGGAGFIGSHLVEAFIARGYEPFVVDSLSSGRRENLPAAVPLYEVDVCDEEGLETVFSEVRPAAVVHLAAQISVSRSVREPVFDARVNVLGWLQVLEQCARRGVRRVAFASSGGVLYGDVFDPAAEDHPVAPASPYGISKWAGEQYLRFYALRYGLQGVALRFANVYGPRQDPHGEAGVVAIFCGKMLRGEPATIFGDGRNVRDYVFVKDAVEAAVLAVEMEMNGGFVALNVGTGIGTDVLGLESRLRSLMEARGDWAGAGRKVPSPRHDEPRPGDLRSSLLSARRAHELLGWVPRVSLDEGLRSTLSWFEQQTLLGQVR